MGKNSNFERNPRDYYPTPYEAVLPLIRHIQYPGGSQKSTFIEPCAGDGRLIRHLAKHGLSCVYACDIEPKDEDIQKRDVLFFDGFYHFPSADMIITNPPWRRQDLHRMIEIFRVNAPTWLLIDLGWASTGQAKQYLKYCHKIIVIGRVSWMDNGVSSLDDCAWYLFTDRETPGYSEFYGRNLS